MSAESARPITLPSGEEIAALRLGVYLGMTVVDMAEMYGAGAAEELVGEALRGRVFLVSKALPGHADRKVTACEGSLRRLRAERLDLCLLHRRGPWCREAGVTVMDYSPIEQGRLLKVEALGAMARALGATPAQVALAWVLEQGVAAIRVPDHPTTFGRTAARWTSTFPPRASRPSTRRSRRPSGPGPW